MASLYRDLHRGLRPGSMHVRKQFSARQRPVQLSGDLQRLQAPQCAIQRGGEDGAVFEDGDGFLPAEAWVIYRHMDKKAGLVRLRMELQEGLGRIAGASCDL